MATKNGLRTYTGSTAVITGGASGIGRALAEELAKNGSEVVLADLQIELAEEAASQIRASGGNATAAKLDVRDFAGVERVVQATVERTGRLDYLFNNAGIGIGGFVQHYSVDDWKQIVDVNLFGVINGVQAAHPIMEKQGFGHIINTASMAGLMPSAGNVAYATTKHAIVGLSTSLRAEVADSGMRVSVLCPGVIRTPILIGGGKYGKMLMEIPSDKQRLMWEKMRPLPPNIFAQRALKAVAGNKPIIIVPSWWKVFWWINRFFPSTGIVLARKMFLDMKKQVGMVQPD